MKFSIITPAYIWDDRTYELFPKCIESIKNQDFDHNEFEHIIVNDGSPRDLSIPNYPWIKVIDQPNLQRMVATNTGLKAATGEWICLLDSDDEYAPEYLSKISKWAKKYPKSKMFNFGAKLLYSDGGVGEKNVFKPAKLKKGHEVFGDGNICKGTFVFKREVFEKLGAFPEGEIKDIDCTVLNYPAGGSMIRDLSMQSPYDFSAWFQLQYPETMKYFMVKHPDHPKLLVKELGNPYGDDYVLFYKYTRVYHSKPFEDHLYIVHLKK